MDRAGNRVAAALVAGLLAGAALRGVGVDLGPGLDLVGAIGGVWVDLLRMTVVPLVGSLLVVAVAQVSDAANTGRLTGRAVALFVVLLTASAIYGVWATSLVLAVWPLDPAAAADLLGTADPTQAPIAEAPHLATWLRSLVPTNPIAAAANDQILPVVVFSLAFGFAATRVADDLRTTVLTGARAVAEVLIAIVRGVLWVAPVGVFALALGVGARAGLGGVSVLAQYVVTVAGVTAGVLVGALVLGTVVGGVPVRRFVEAAGPPLVIAFSTQSSLATLPAMLERAPLLTKADQRVARLVLPLAVALFRLTSPTANLAVVLFVAAVYGIHPTMLQLGSAVLVAVAVSLGSVGLPGQVSFFAAVAPIGLAVGIPLELLPVLLAVEVIPDLFRTMGNVAADLAVTAILDRFR